MSVFVFSKSFASPHSHEQTQSQHSKAFSAFQLPGMDSWSNEMDFVESQTFSAEAGVSFKQNILFPLLFTPWIVHEKSENDFYAIEIRGKKITKLLADDVVWYFFILQHYFFSCFQGVEWTPSEKWITLSRLIAFAALLWRCEWSEGFGFSFFFSFSLNARRMDDEFFITHTRSLN